MSAYGIEYLDDAMRNLGEMTDYAVNACGMDLEDFWKLFLTTGYAEKSAKYVDMPDCSRSRPWRRACRSARQSAAYPIVVVPVDVLVDQREHLPTGDNARILAHFGFSGLT